MNWTRLPARLLEFTTVLAGVWQIYGTFIVRTDRTFNELLGGLPWVVMASLALWMLLGDVLSEVPDADLPAEPPPPKTRVSPWWALVSGALTIVALYGWYSEQWSWMFAWLGFVAHALILQQGLPQIRISAVRVGKTTAPVLLTAALLGNFAALSINLPEGDDAYYLNQVVATLEHPNLPLLSFDGMHGDVKAPIQQVGHRAQMYETLGSVVAYLTNHPGGDAYYIYLPAIFGFLAVVANWALAVALVGRRAGSLAALAFLPIAILWGGHYYTYGNYTFNRIFQGKGVALLLGLPLCTLFGLRFGVQPTLRTAAYVTLAQLTAASHTSSALIIAPIAAALGALPGLQLNRKGMKVVALGALSTVPLLTMLLFVKFEMDDLPRVPFSGEKLDLVPLMGGEGELRTFLGPALLVGVMALIRYHRSASSGLFMRYVLVLLLFLFNDTTTRFLGEHAGAHISWRGYWAAPYITVLAAGVGMGLDAGFLRGRNPLRWMVGALTAVLLFGFVNAGGPTFIRHNWAQWKVHPADAAIVNALVGLTGPESKALLHPQVAGRLAGVTGRPKIVNARRIYVRNLSRYWGLKEARQRQYLLRFANDGKDVDYNWALQQLDERCVDLFATGARTHRTHRDLRNDLESMDFIMERYGRWFLYYRPVSSCRKGIPWSDPR